jgi:hypothetical protein
MKSKGIRIEDIDNNSVITVKLPSILEEIQDGNAFHWSILYLHSSGNLGEGISYPAFEAQINHSERGLFITFEELLVLINKLNQIIDIVLIGCKNVEFLKWSDSDQEMYETCDIYIEMHDGCFWEVFSKDENFINRLAAKFKKVKILESNFQTKKQ